MSDGIRDVLPAFCIVAVSSCVVPCFRCSGYPVPWLYTVESWCLNFLQSWRYLILSIHSYFKKGEILSELCLVNCGLSSFSSFTPPEQRNFIRVGRCECKCVLISVYSFHLRIHSSTGIPYYLKPLPSNQKHFAPTYNIQQFHPQHPIHLSIINR